jgi:hypothetical protein
VLPSRQYTGAPPHHGSLTLRDAVRQPINGSKEQGEIMPEEGNNQDDSDFVAELAEASKENPETVEGEQPKPAEEPKEGLEVETSTKPKTEEPPEGEKPNDEPQKSPEELEAERKERNRQFYEQRQAERQQKQRQIERTVDSQYQPQTMAELTNKFMEQGYDEFQAQMLARDERREQQAQINEARTQIAELNMQIETEAVQVMHDFPVFDPTRKEYDKDFAEKASQLYVRAASPVTDPKTGLVIQANMTPYQFYQHLAEMRGSGVSQAQVKAQTAVQQQMAAVTPQSSVAPPKEDAAAAAGKAFDAAWDD